MKKLLLLLSVITLIFTTVSCTSKGSNPTADQTATRQTDQAMQEASRQAGMPAIVNFQEKKLMKMIYELRDQADLITYTYYIDMNGNKHFLGKSLGYGLPYSTQYSNPQRLVDVTDYGISSYQSNDAAVISQPEPNGMFMPDGLSATWVILLDENDEPKVVYIESEILVSPFKLH